MNEVRPQLAEAAAEPDGRPGNRGPAQAHALPGQTSGREACGEHAVPLGDEVDAPPPGGQLQGQAEGLLLTSSPGSTAVDVEGREHGSATGHRGQPSQHAAGSSEHFLDGDAGHAGAVCAGGAHAGPAGLLVEDDLMAFAEGPGAAGVGGAE